MIAQDHVGAENHGPGETVPPPTPDRGSGMPPKSRNLDKQVAKVSRSHFPVNGAHVLNEAMSEDTSTAAAKNGVSLPVKPASDSGGDHMGTPGGGPEVIAQDHVGTENHGPGETVPPPDSGSRVRDAPEIEAPRQTSGQSVKKPL